MVPNWYYEQRSFQIDKMLLLRIFIFWMFQNVVRLDQLLSFIAKRGSMHYESYLDYISRRETSLVVYLPSFFPAINPFSLVFFFFFWTASIFSSWDLPSCHWMKLIMSWASLVLSLYFPMLMRMFNFFIWSEDSLLWFGSRREEAQLCRRRDSRTIYSWCLDTYSRGTSNQRNYDRSSSSRGKTATSHAQRLTSSWGTTTITGLSYVVLLPPDWLHLWWKMCKVC